jgi:hypothetical protein
MGLITAIIARLCGFVQRTLKKREMSIGIYVWA